MTNFPNYLTTTGGIPVEACQRGNVTRKVKMIFKTEGEYNAISGRKFHQHSHVSSANGDGQDG